MLSSLEESNLNTGGKDSTIYLCFGVLLVDEEVG